MVRYLITEKAGRFVAGHRNTGVGTVLELLPLAAEYELRLGTLVPADLPPLQVEALETESAPGPEPVPGAPEAPPNDDVSAPEAAPQPAEDGGAVEPPSAGGKRKRRR
jgi:hypothetical protein